ncbi:hypothetical protein LJR234_005733 [Mesorhizobium amorphae]|uniref:hypothetical protein n=1 Tax=Mesorhizobium amorphae TaxID=71433 RepID=UPI003ECFD88E
MPLVFVHGVATRPTAEYRAAVVQRDALFRSLVFESGDIKIFNPDWGSAGVSFDAAMPWLPNASGNQAFGAGDAVADGTGDAVVALGTLAGLDGEQAVDLVAMAALDGAIRDAAEQQMPDAAAVGSAMALAQSVGAYLKQKGLIANETPLPVDALMTSDNLEFADALEHELAEPVDGKQAFGIGNAIRDALGHLGGLIGNSASDLALKAKRRDLSRGVALFLGDVFVYLRGRDDRGPDGTRRRIFKPIIDALIAGAKARSGSSEPLVVVGHSLGGVLLYDILTDEKTRATIEAETGSISIDALFTVGSQAGFFADLGLYPHRPQGGAKLPLPDGVRDWMNVYDFTDVFSFRCAPMFEGVRDFGYDTVTDLMHAHSAYFLRPSFYKRMRARLKETGSL